MQEQVADLTPMQRATFVAWDIEDCLVDVRYVWAITRGQNWKESHPSLDETLDSKELDELEELNVSQEYWGATNPPANIHVHISNKYPQEFLEGYKKDRSLVKLWDWN